MSSEGMWPKPGWPWELETVSVFFAVAAIVVPFYLSSVSPTDVSAVPLAEQAELDRELAHETYWGNQKNLSWALIVGAIYLAHLVAAWAAHRFMSTPLVHLISPLLFAFILYYRLVDRVLPDASATAIVKGSFLEVALLAFVVGSFTFVVARVRMARYLLHLKHVRWDISTPTVLDSTFKHLMIYLQPLLYPPRILRTSSDGILIQGWLYVMPLPFQGVQSVDRVSQKTQLKNGHLLATSMKHLVRVRLKETDAPVYVSPEDTDEFCDYCQRRVNALRPEVGHVAPVVLS